MPIPTTDIAIIEPLCQVYEREASALESLVADLESDLEAIRAKHLRPLKRQVAAVAGREAALIAAVEANPDLFVKPRTMVLHGVKVGYSVSPGRVEFDDAESVMKAIRRLRAEDEDVLIRTKEEPNKDALRSLAAPDLAKLGCRIDGAGNVVVVKRVAGDVEKMVSKLLDRLVEAMAETE